ncbi:hypothetical protein Bint_2199 [Brachyspira intermedia PWS/A]|uniref:Uncharacterized protein n=1 Tax=Brachyspira intermedia (strain ATCC 51140 / PWS/A) TaxID=1045858 RepID=G0ELV8_BRAIP|nr:hypothetical protein Bint_2199 [Brachyspira intermedia PWS/A]
MPFSLLFTCIYSNMLADNVYIYSIAFEEYLIDSFNFI